MDSWTLQGDSYSFLRNSSTPRILSLRHRDRTPNHVEIFDITNIPSHRSAISETTCLCDIFGDDCESRTPSLSSSPATRASVQPPIPPLRREAAGTGESSGSPPVSALVLDELNDSTSSYHTAPESFEDSSEELSPPVQSENKSNISEDRELGDTATPRDNSSLSTPGQRTANSSPEVPQLTSEERTPSPGDSNTRTFSSDGSCLVSSVVRISPAPSTQQGITDLSPITGDRYSCPSAKSVVSVHSTEDRNLDSSPGVRGPASSPDVTHTLSSPETREAPTEPGSVSPLNEVIANPFPSDYIASFEPSVRAVKPEPQAISPSTSLTISGTGTSPQQGGTSTSPEFKDRTYSPEIERRVSIPDLFSRTSSPELEDTVSASELIPHLPPADRHLSSSEGTRRSVSTPGPRYTPPTPVTYSQASSPELRSVSSTPELRSASITPELRSTSVKAEPSLLSIPAKLRSSSVSTEASITSVTPNSELLSSNSLTPEFRSDSNLTSSYHSESSFSSDTWEKTSSRTPSPETHFNKTPSRTPSPETHFNKTPSRTPSPETHFNKTPSRTPSPETHFNKTPSRTPSPETHFNKTPSRTPSPETHFNKTPSRTPSTDLHSNKTLPRTPSPEISYNKISSRTSTPETHYNRTPSQTPSSETGHNRTLSRKSSPESHFNRTPSKKTSPETNHNRTPSRTYNNTAPPPEVKYNSPLIDPRSTAPSPEIRITASTPEIKRRDLTPEITRKATPLDHCFNAPPHPSSSTSSPQVSGISNSILSPEGRELVSTLDINSPISSPELGDRTHLSRERKSTTPTEGRHNSLSPDSIGRHSSPDNRASNTSAGITGIFTSILHPPDSSDKAISPEPPTYKNLSPEYKNQSPVRSERASPDPRFKTPSPQPRYAEKVEAACSSPDLNTTINSPGSPTDSPSSPEVDNLSEHLTNGTSNHLDNHLSHDSRQTLPTEESRAINSSPVRNISSEIRNVSPQIRNISPQIRNISAEIRPTPPDSTVSLNGRSPSLSLDREVPDNLPFQNVDDLEAKDPALLLTPELSDISNQSTTPEHPGRENSPNLRNKPIEKLTEEDMAHRMGKENTPSPPLTRFTPVHIIPPSPGRQQGHWGKRSHSQPETQANEALMVSGNISETPIEVVKSRECSNFSNDSQAHLERLERGLQMEQLWEMQERNREMQRERQRERQRDREREEERERDEKSDRQKEEHRKRAMEREREWQQERERQWGEWVPGKLEGREGEASNRGEQVDLSFSARNRKEPASHRAAPTSKESQHGMSAAHNYSESLLATRLQHIQQPQQQQSAKLHRTAHSYQTETARRGGPAPNKKLQPKPGIPQFGCSIVGHVSYDSPGPNSSSNMGSELDEEDNEVKWFSDVAFQSLSSGSPQVDYLDMYNSSHCSSTGASQPSTQDSPAGATAAWLAYADLRGSGPRLDNEDFQVTRQQQPLSGAFYTPHEGLDPSKKYEMGSFECVDVAVEKDEPKKVRRGVPKRQIQLKRKNTAELKLGEKTDSSPVMVPGPAVSMVSPSLQRRNRESLQRQHSTPATFQEPYCPEPSAEKPERPERMGTLQKSLSMDETGTKTKMATCLIKSILSKKMQNVGKQSDLEGGHLSPSEEQNPPPEREVSMLKPNSWRSDTVKPEMGSDLLFPFESKKSREMDPMEGKQSNDSKWRNEIDDKHLSDSADVRAQVRSTQAGITNTKTLKTDSENHEQPRVKNTYMSKTPEITLKPSPFTEKKTSSLNVSLTPELEMKPDVNHEAANCERTCQRETREEQIFTSHRETRGEEQIFTSHRETREEKGMETFNKMNEHIENVEANGKGKTKAPLHKVRDVRKLVKNTYNLSFKAAPALEKDDGKEEGVKRREEQKEGHERDERREEWWEDMNEKIVEKREEKIVEKREDIIMEKGKERKGDNLPPLPIYLQKEEKSMSRPQPIQIEYKAVSWKESKITMSNQTEREMSEDRPKSDSLKQVSAVAAREPEHPFHITPASCATEEVAVTETEMSQHKTPVKDTVKTDTDKTEVKPRQTETQRTTRRQRSVSESDKPEVMRRDTKPPMLGSSPNLPSKDRGVSSASLVLQDGSSKAKCLSNSAPASPAPAMPAYSSFPVPAFSTSTTVQASSSSTPALASPSPASVPASPPLASVPALSNPTRVPASPPLASVPALSNPTPVPASPTPASGPASPTPVPVSACPTPASEPASPSPVSVPALSNPTPVPASLTPAPVSACPTPASVPASPTPVPVPASTAQDPISTPSLSPGPKATSVPASSPAPTSSSGPTSSLGLTSSPSPTPVLGNAPSPVHSKIPTPIICHSVSMLVKEKGYQADIGSVVSEVVSEAVIRDVGGVPRKHINRIEIPLQSHGTLDGGNIDSDEQRIYSSLSTSSVKVATSVPSSSAVKESSSLSSVPIKTSTSASVNASASSYYTHSVPTSPRLPRVSSQMDDSVRNQERVSVRATVRDIEQRTTSPPQQKKTREDTVEKETVKKSTYSPKLTGSLPGSPALMRRYRPQAIEVKSLSKEINHQDKQETTVMSNSRPQPIEVRSIANGPPVAPKPKFRLTDVNSLSSETQQEPFDVAPSSFKQHKEERLVPNEKPSTSAMTIQRQLSCDSTPAPNYNKKLSVSAVSSYRPPPTKTTIIASFCHKPASTTTTDTETTNDRLKQPAASTQGQGQAPSYNPLTSTALTAPGPGPTSTQVPTQERAASPAQVPTHAPVRDSSQSTVVDVTSHQQHPQTTTLSFPQEQALPVTFNNTKRPAAISTQGAPRYTHHIHTHQPLNRSLSSDHSQRAGDLHFYASDDPPSYDERESFSPLHLPDLPQRRLNRYHPSSPSSRHPPCSCTSSCPSHPSHNRSPHPHHHPPHTHSPPAPSHSPGHALPYSMGGQPPIRLHPSRADLQPLSSMGYQPSSPKSSTFSSPNHPPQGMYQSLQQAPPHPSMLQPCPADRPLQPPPHMDPRRGPPLLRAPQGQPTVSGGPYSDHSHSPNLPSMDPQYLCGPQSLGPSYGSEYGSLSGSDYPDSTGSLGYGQNPRRVLMDPETGKYFYIEMPVQPLRKMLFDPETGQYVEVLIPQSTMSHSGLYPPSAAPYSPTSAAPYPSIHNPNMYAPAPQYLPYGPPPPVPHSQAQPQPPSHPEIPAPGMMHQNGAQVSYSSPGSQGSKTETQSRASLDQSYLESMYYVPTGMNTSPPDCFHKKNPGLPNTGGKRA